MAPVYQLNMHPDTHVFIVPGLGNSGPRHWQTLWERQYGFSRIEQEDWDTPDCNDWIQNIESKTAILPPEKIILVGHSAGCSAIVHWACKFQHPVRGVLLVAPSDADSEAFPSGASGFRPTVLDPLPFPSIVIYSENDPFVSPERARFFAMKWEGLPQSIGFAGHINADSGLGSWYEGYSFLKRLMKGIS